MLIQGPGQQGLSQTVICKQAGASLIIVTGTAKDGARMKVAKQLGADYVIDVSKEDPLARITEITGGKGVDVALDCTAGAGTIPIMLGVEALKRKGGIIVAQGEMREFPNFPLEKFTVKFITMKSARGHSYRACELALAQLASKRFPLEMVTTHRFGLNDVDLAITLGRRRGRAGRHPRLADAVAVAGTTLANERPIIAIATGDPAGIGPEISLKAALDARVRAACRPILVSDPGLIERHANACGIAADLRAINTVSAADWSDARVNVLACTRPDAVGLAFGTTDAASGRASIAFVRAAVNAALGGEVDAVVAAPQNETSIALAAIPFDGHPSFVARETGTDEDDVYLMLWFGKMRIAHCTLHRSVKQAIALITRERVARVIRATDRALRRLGIAAPKIAVSGLNPHAGEGGLFGPEEIEIIKPAIDMAREEGLDVTGPFGADIMLHMEGFDAFVVMLHDQGHIPAKLMAPNATAALTIGTPILFSSVAHGSAHDIAGKGVADATAIVEAVLRLSTAQRAAGPRAVTA